MYLIVKTTLETAFAAFEISSTEKAKRNGNIIVVTIVGAHPAKKIEEIAAKVKENFDLIRTGWTSNDDTVLTFVEFLCKDDEPKPAKLPKEKQPKAETQPEQPEPAELLKLKDKLKK